MFLFSSSQLTDRLVMLLLVYKQADSSLKLSIRSDGSFEGFSSSQLYHSQIQKQRRVFNIAAIKLCYNCKINCSSCTHTPVESKHECIGTTESIKKRHCVQISIAAT